MSDFPQQIRNLAENEYRMPDGYLLQPTGTGLLAAADHIEALEVEVERLAATINEDVERLKRRDVVRDAALAEAQATVERLTVALREEQAESLRQAEIARDALARIPDPEDVLWAAQRADEFASEADQWAGGHHQAKVLRERAARLRATLGEEGAK